VSGSSPIVENLFCPLNPYNTLTPDFLHKKPKIKKEDLKNKTVNKIYQPSRHLDYSQFLLLSF
jgi:hypothetical protein